MSRKRYSLEKIIGMLRKAEVALAQGMTVAQVSNYYSVAQIHALSLQQMTIFSIPCSVG